MSYTTTWHVLDMKRETSNGYVYNVLLQLKAIDDVDSSKIFAVNHSVHLSRPETLGIAYSDLTEATVIEWCKKLMEDSQIEPDLSSLQWIENKIKQEMEDGIGQGLPWT